MRAGRALVLSVPIAFVIGACSLFTDLGGFSNGGDSPETSTSPDGTTPGSNDATSGNEGGASADADGGSPAPENPCFDNATHTFCARFDEGALSDVFETVNQGDGTLSLDVAIARSKPRSLAVGVPAADIGSLPHLKRSFDVQSLSSIDCSFAFRRDAVSDDGTMVVMIYDIASDNGSYEFAEIKSGGKNMPSKVYVQSTQSNGQKADTFPDIPSFAKPNGEWGRVRFSLSLATSKALVTLDGANVYQETVPTAPGGAMKKVTVTFGLLKYLVPSTPWLVHYDDLVCDLAP